MHRNLFKMDKSSIPRAACTSFFLLGAVACGPTTKNHSPSANDANLVNELPSEEQLNKGGCLFTSISGFADQLKCQRKDDPESEYHQFVSILTYVEQTEKLINKKTLHLKTKNQLLSKQLAANIYLHQKSIHDSAEAIGFDNSGIASETELKVRYFRELRWIALHYGITISVSSIGDVANNPPGVDVEFHKAKAITESPEVRQRLLQLIADFTEAGVGGDSYYIIQLGIIIAKLESMDGAR